MIKFIEHLEGLIVNKARYSKGIYALFKLESKLAYLNIYPLFIGLIALFILGLVGWITFMILIGYFILVLSKEPFYAILGVFGINFALIVGFIRSLKHRLQEMSFTRTRNCLRKSKGNNHESEKKTIAEVDSPVGEED